MIGQEMRDIYTITEENGHFKAIAFENYLMFEGIAQTVTQHGTLLIVQQNDTFNIYIAPVVDFARRGNPLIGPQNGLIHVFENVSTYLYHSGVLVLKINISKTSGYWTFLIPSYFGKHINEHNKLVKKLADLPRITFAGVSEAKFVKDFDYLRDSFFLNIDSNLYLCTFDQFGDTHYFVTPIEDPSPVSKPYEYFKAHPNSWAGPYFQSTKKDGKWFYKKSEKYFGPFYEIVPFSETDYPYISNEFIGYWGKNKDGLILGFIILKESDDTVNYYYDYKMQFDAPVKKIAFHQRLIVDKNDGRPDAIDFWKLTFSDGTEKFLLKGIGSHEYLKIESIL